MRRCATERTLRLPIPAALVNPPQDQTFTLATAEGAYFRRLTGAKKTGQASKLLKEHRLGWVYGPSQAQARTRQRHR